MSTQETATETTTPKKAKNKKAAKATKPAKAKKGAKVGPLKPKQFKRAREGPFAVMIRATVLSVGSGRTAMR